MEALAGLFTTITPGATAGATASSLFGASTLEGPLLASGQFLSGAGAASGTAGSILGYLGQGATLLQGLAGFQSGQANASYLDQASKQALRVGAANKDIMDARGRAQLGELRAQIGAQGTTMSGSPMLVYLDSVRNAAIDSASEYYKGAVESSNYKTQAKLARAGAQDTLFSGILGAAAPSIASIGSRLLR